MDESLKAQIQAARERALHNRTHDFPIPGTDDTLWGTFRALDDWGEVRGIAKAALAASNDETTQELYIAADNLVRSCIDIYAFDAEGQKHSIADGLTLDLAHELFEGVALTPRQAVFEIFPTTKSVALFFAELETWFTETHEAVDA